MLVEEIEGDYFNVVGLPVPTLLRLMPSLLHNSWGPGSRLDCWSPSGCGRCVPHPSPIRLQNGLLQLPHRYGRPRHGRRSRHRQYARLRARARNRALRAVRGRDRLAHRRGACRRDRGEAHARPYTRHDPGDPPPEGRRDRRLRRDRADASALHPEGAPEPLGAPARGGVRAVRRDRRREARGGGGLPQRRRAPGVPDRGAHGGRDRRRAAGWASPRGTWSSTSAAARARLR